MAEKRATAAAGVIFRHQTHANIFQWPRLHCKKSLILFMAFTRTVWWETEYYNYVHCFFPHKIIVAEEFHDYSRIKHFLFVSQVHLRFPSALTTAPIVSQP